MNFEYLETIRKEASIDIETPGKCSLQAFTDEGEEYYLVIDTKLGFTKVKTYGPFIDNEQSEVFTYSTYSLEYSEQKLYKIINDFLNGRKPKTQVFECDESLTEESLAKIKL